MSLFILSVVVSLVYCFEIVYGLAGTVILIPIMSFFFPTKVLVVYSILPQMAAFLMAIISSPKVLNFRFLLKMLFYAFLGAAAGLYLFSNLSDSVFELMLASLITLCGLYLVFIPSGLKLNSFWKRLFDMLAGFSHVLFGISGPIVMTRMLSTFENKTEIRNHALAFFFSMNLVRLSSYLWNGEFTPEILKMMEVSVLPLLLGLYVGNKLHRKSSDKSFRRVVSYVILVCGVIMLSKTL